MGEAGARLQANVAGALREWAGERFAVDQLPDAASGSARISFRTVAALMAFGQPA